MKKHIQIILKDIVVTIGILSVVTGLCLLLDRMDDVQHSDAYVSMLFILAVFLVSRVTNGYLFGLLASLYGVLTVNYFFTYPYFEFNFSMPGYPITMVALVSVSMLTSALTTRMKRQEQVRAEAEKEKLRSDLLRAISHDFRTPLTSIIGANAVLSENGEALSESQKQQLHQTIEKEAQWLRRIVENLLMVTRISESSEAKILKSPEVVEEIVAAAVEKFKSRFPALPVIVTVPDEVVICSMDALLMEQALLNLLQNAALHAKNASYVKIAVTCEEKNLVVSVSDDGCGMKPEFLNRFRLNKGIERDGYGDSTRTTGIGLTVCNAIATAHDGTLRLSNGAHGGFCATILLPLEG
ncbi:MAG: DUF4118 domain-containing protein [Eubacteriales bacterium]|nr:DUF4118 domain-containing protein [Eubacteriales bacterium]